MYLRRKKLFGLKGDPMKNLIIENFTRIRRAEIAFGDLTVFVGPQATGKTLVLELMKLVEDRPAIMSNLKKHEFDRARPARIFLLGILTSESKIVKNLIKQLIN